jgi:hypothetical protein
MAGEVIWPLQSNVNCKRKERDMFELVRKSSNGTSKTRITPAFRDSHNAQLRIVELD